MKQKIIRRPRGPTLKEQRSQETKRRLVEAASKLFAEYGYHAVGVTDIAREAGVTHSMINVYFNSKAGLLYQIIKEANAVQTEETAALMAEDGSVKERLERIIHTWASHDLKAPELLAVMQSYFWTWPEETEEENRQQVAMALATVQKVLTDGMASGEVREDLDTGRAVRAIFAIYTMGLRPAVYYEASIDDCVAEIMAQIEMLIG